MGHATDRGSPGIPAHMEVVQHLGNEIFGSIQPGLLTKPARAEFFNTIKDPTTNYSCFKKKGAAAERG